MTGPLAGLHVVEIATEISGPYAAKLFVDLGAEVTKIELPGGDPLRDWGPFPHGVPDPERSGLFEYLNAGKRIAALEDARELIARAHVLVENFPPGTLEALGISTATACSGCAQTWCCCAYLTSGSADRGATGRRRR